MSVPVCLIAYKRPQFFGRFLQSLTSQSISLKNYEFYLFLDGVVADAEEKSARDVALIAETESLFRSYLPQGICFTSEVNIGIAANWERAEIFAFDVLRAPVALFFEEDVELGPEYFHVMEILQRLLLDNDFVAGWSAFAHSMDVPSGRSRQRLIPTMPLWGVAQKRSFFDARRSLMQLYYGSLAGRPYHERCPQALFYLFRLLGVGCDFDGDPVSSCSQDNFRRLATTYVGGLFFSAPGNYARYIGRYGEHFREEDFNAAGYANMPLADLDELDFEVPERAHLEFDVNARLRWYRKFETDHLPVWASTATHTPDLRSVARSLSMASGQTIDANLEAMRRGAADDEISSLRACLLKDPFCQLILRFEFIKINLGRGNDHFFRAVCLPKAVLSGDMDYLFGPEVEKRIFVIEAETESHLLRECHAINKFWQRALLHDLDLEIWLCMPCEDASRSMAVQLLQNLAEKPHADWWVLRRDQCGTALSDRDVYLLTKDFVFDREDNLFMILRRG